VDEHDRAAGADVVVVEFDRLAVVGAGVQAGHGSPLVSDPRSLTHHPTVRDRTR
jgi:hypothetical protein